MKATVFSTPARRYSDSKDGRITVYVDALGLGVAFDDEPMTASDFSVVNDMFSTPGVKMKDVIDEWFHAILSDSVVFEAGAHVPYEGLYSAELFATYEDAVEHAKKVADDDYMTPEVYARKVLS